MDGRASSFVQWAILLTAHRWGEVKRLLATGKEHLLQATITLDEIL